jgi:4-hydroxy-L-threonine phosphate dehydrogenase PdxA
VNGMMNVDFLPGNCNAASGRATITYVEAALEIVKIGAASAILACPHNETAVNAAGIAFTGYPGLLAKLNSLPEDRVFLMLVGGGLRIVHATLHESLAGAFARLNTSLVVAAATAANKALITLGISAPRIGVLGIDPHAGENGLFGHADEQITFPAAAKLREDGINIAGPLGADLLLAERNCDAYVAMYHDQGHIPVKLLAGRNSSAFSIGAGVLFASVGHGSAPDIAGQDKADPDPVLRTLRLMVDVAAFSNKGSVI